MSSNNGERDQQDSVQGIRQETEQNNNQLNLIRHIYLQKKLISKKLKANLTEKSYDAYCNPAFITQKYRGKREANVPHPIMKAIKSKNLIRQLYSYIRS